MSILVYAESEEKKFSKNIFQVVSFAKQLADKTKSTLTAVTINNTENKILQKYGAAKIININASILNDFQVKSYALALKEVIEKNKIETVVISTTTNSRALAAYLSILIEASYVSNVTEVPKNTSPLIVKQTCFSTKAFSFVSMKTKRNIIGVAKNNFNIESPVEKANYEQINISLKQENNFKIIKKQQLKSKVSVADADIIVAGGRGLKSAENWNLIENLATILGAATACSKPVSDMGWRPHSEHVGQTGKTVAPNLYIAVAISGAIQHLAGINASKIKVVINKDPQAPFFEAANYGIIGDAFEIVPQLIEKLKNYFNKNR